MADPRRDLRPGTVVDEATCLGADGIASADRGSGTYPELAGAPGPHPEYVSTPSGVMAMTCAEQDRCRERAVRAASASTRAPRSRAAVEQPQCHARPAVPCVGRGRAGRDGPTPIPGSPDRRPPARRPPVRAPSATFPQRPSARAATTTSPSRPRGHIGMKAANTRPTANAKFTSVAAGSENPARATRRAGPGASGHREVPAGGSLSRHVAQHHGPGPDPAR